MLKTSLLILILPFLFITPSLEWTSATQHDFGEVIHKQSVHHTFTFTNRGDGPLTVETVRSTCGCTVPEWPRYPILPDSTGQITVTYDAQKKGAFRKTIKVYFHEIRQAERLFIQGNTK